MLEINALDALPYKAPEPVPAKDMEVVDEQTVEGQQKQQLPKAPKPKKADDILDPETDEEGQTSLF